MTTRTAPALREILGVQGLHDSEIDDTDEREALVAAVETGHVHRESIADSTPGTEDFVRVVEYDVPGEDSTRFALHRVQGGDLTYIHDSSDRAQVDAAYEEAVRDLAEDCGYVFIASDVDGVPTGGDDPQFDEDEDEEEDEEI